MSSTIIKEKRALEIFKKYIHNKNAKILDVGSGDGLFGYMLNENGYSKIDEIPNEEHTDISFQKIKSKSEHYDVITAWEVLEHLENPWNFVRESYRILRGGGC